MAGTDKEKKGNAGGDKAGRKTESPGLRTAALSESLKGPLFCVCSGISIVCFPRGGASSHWRSKLTLSPRHNRAVHRLSEADKQHC